MTTELVLDRTFADVVVCSLVIELGWDTKEEESLCDLKADLADAEEVVEEVLAKFAGRNPAVRTVEVESDLNTDTVGDLGLEADLILGSGSSR